MKITNYGFIVKGTGYNAKTNKSTLDSGAFKTTVVGVETDERAIEVAQQMLAEGVQLIELCGGFDSNTADTIMDALENAIPVGYVTFSKKAQTILDKNTPKRSADFM